MELQLNVGSQLQFSTMPEPNLELSEASSLGELSLDSGLAATADSRAAATAAVRQSTPIETEAIVDRTPEVTAIETPDIKPVMTSIVDTAKEVAEIATPEIATGAPDIVDEAKQVAEMESPAIVSQAMSIPADETPRIQVSSVPAFDKQRAPSLPTAPLREMHVVQPSTNAPQPADESEMVIEAEVISGDEAEDAIIIIDDEYRIR
jgi:hypothetical protein